MIRAMRIGFLAACLLVALLLASPAASYAQHGDYLLGTLGLLGGAQAPEGIYYQNIFSYYNASGSRTFDASRTKDLDIFRRQLSLTASANLDLKANLAVYVDQNIIGMTTPFRILGANYGFMVDVPFAQVTGSGTATLDVGADLKGFFDRTFTRGASFSRAESSTASFNLADMYVEPVNLGWHLPQLDVVATLGFFAPSGSYNHNKAINNGLGRWAEMAGLGSVLYLDAERSWSVSAMTRYVTHQRQEGEDIRVGDNFIVEWGVGKTFRPPSWKPWVAQLDVGAVGYAQWQMTDNRGSDIALPLRGLKSNVFATGPEIAATTKIGRFFARYEFEFGTQGNPQGQVFLFGWAALIDPFKK
jgi:hypothetical protein